MPANEMFRLTREVRLFEDGSGAGRVVRVQVTLAGELDRQTSFLRDIKEIDLKTRERLTRQAMSSPCASVAFGLLADAFPGSRVHSICIWLNPFVSLSQLGEEFPMTTRLSRRFEFCAAHRLHNPSLSDEKNQTLFGKCNNPHGHGHNYEMQVTLRGRPNSEGLLVEIPAFEQIVQDRVVSRWDHRNLNVEIPEFQQVMPTVENIARVAYEALKGSFSSIGAELASVTVWETPKTWCEYSE